MPDFIPGLILNEAYYWEAVRPILDSAFPGLPHAAALIGFGSDVIGLDTATSTDHLWGPRLYLFLNPQDLEDRAAAVDQALRQRLPVSFRGYSTNFSRPNPTDHGVRSRDDIDHGPVDHLITLTTISDFWSWYLGPGADPFRDLAPADWLTFANHQLLVLTAGKVFHDDLGLEAARARLAWYPRDVWLYLLSAQWKLISQEEAFVGRTHQVGDELGSRVVAARQAERLMRLCFLMEKRYAPYSKWFGTTFSRLACAPRMSPLLESALASADYAGREARLAAAYTLAAEMHNALGITPPLETRTRTYSGWHAAGGRDTPVGAPDLALDDPGNTRPHQVIFGERFVDAIRAQIQDPAVLACIPDLGSVDQFLVESSDARQNLTFCRGLLDDIR